MITACVIVAVIIIFAALIAVASDRGEQRDQHRVNAERLAAELDAAYARLGEVLDEHALCPAPVQTRLQLVPPQRDGSEYEWPRIARVLELEAGEA